MPGVAAGVAYKAASSDREYQRLIAAGEASLAAGQTSLAIEAFSGAIALSPDSMLAYLKRGETYRHEGDLRAALRDLRTANSLDPTATRPLEQLGDVFIALQRPDRAAERYAAYVQIDDRSPQVLYKLALAHYRAGHARDAIKPARQALALNNRFAEAHYLLGLCLEADREHREAIRSFEQADRLAPALTPAREALAAAYRAVGRHRDAIDQLEAVAALDRERVGPRWSRWPLHMLTPAGRIWPCPRWAGRPSGFPRMPSVFAALGEVWLKSAEARSDDVALGKALEALRDGGGAGQRNRPRAGAVRPGAAPGGRHRRRAAIAAGGRDQAAGRARDLSASRDGAVAAGRHACGARRAAALRRAATGLAVSRDVAYQIGEWSIALREPATATTWLVRALDAASPDPRVVG